MKDVAGGQACWWLALRGSIRLLHDHDLVNRTQFLQTCAHRLFSKVRKSNDIVPREITAAIAF